MGESSIFNIGIILVLCQGVWWTPVGSETTQAPIAPSVGSETTETPKTPSADISVVYSIPTIEEHIRSLNVVVDMTSFKNCDPKECKEVCGTKDPKMAYCDPNNKKLCMCDPRNFHPSEWPGTIDAVNRDIDAQRNCSVGCNKRDAYGRIWQKRADDWSCLCMMNQLTPTKITKCDPLAKMDVCRAVCQTDTASCSFNGACLCRKTWNAFFKKAMENVREEVTADNDECDLLCKDYHHDYIGRIYDSKMTTPNASYSLREKFCACGEWMNIASYPETTAILKQGFQLCTGLKCKQRCGMDEAICEPNFRRGCLCPRENAILGNHLWIRLPNPTESKCYDTCGSYGLDARVIEWNPFMSPQDMFFEPHYRKSTFQYLYDGKFCHCIQHLVDMHQYRPCTDEFCRVICGHHGAECDKRTRRTCFCNTHKLSHDLGRGTDPAEVNCDISCRYGLYDAKILDVHWDIPVDSWGVKVSKYCTCIKRTGPSGLSHCDPLHDECPKYCGGIAKAYCTREKYCHCGMVRGDLTARSPLIRLGNGKENDECGEKCRSWMWPMAIDSDNQPYIYDEHLGSCSDTDPCPPIDTSPWKPEEAGQMSINELDSRTREFGERISNNRKFCLCAKTAPTTSVPGNRFIAHIEPERIPDDVPCFFNHTCAIVGKGLRITA